MSLFSLKTPKMSNCATPRRDPSTRRLLFVENNNSDSTLSVSVSGTVRKPRSELEPLFKVLVEKLSARNTTFALNTGRQNLQPPHGPLVAEIIMELEGKTKLSKAEENLRWLLCEMNITGNANERQVGRKEQLLEYLFFLYDLCFQHGKTEQGKRDFAQSFLDYLLTHILPHNTKIESFKSLLEAAGYQDSQFPPLYKQRNNNQNTSDFKLRASQLIVAKIFDGKDGSVWLLKKRSEAKEAFPKQLEFLCNYWRTDAEGIDQAESLSEDKTAAVWKVIDNSDPENAAESMQEEERVAVCIASDASAEEVAVGNATDTLASKVETAQVAALKAENKALKAEIATLKAKNELLRQETDQFRRAGPLVEDFAKLWGYEVLSVTDTTCTPGGLSSVTSRTANLSLQDDSSNRQVSPLTVQSNFDGTMLTDGAISMNGDIMHTAAGRGFLQFVRSISGKVPGLLDAVKTELSYPNDFDMDSIGEPKTGRERALAGLYWDVELLELLEVIGGGSSFGSVVRACLKGRPDCHAVIKFEGFSCFSFARYFRRELLCGGRVIDKNIVKCFGYFHVNQAETTKKYAIWTGLILEECTTTLRTEIESLQNVENGLDKLLRVCRITHHILEGLLALWNQNIQHRDVKPENILLGKDGEWKIGDFGLARVVGAEDNDRTEGVGTKNYMAPEECSDEQDVYSVGVVFFELMTGNLPQGLSGEVVTKAFHIQDYAISQRAGNFCEQMLKYNSEARLTVVEAEAEAKAIVASLKNNFAATN